MRLIFDRPAKNTLDVDGDTVHGQQEFEVSDERGEQLLAQGIRGLRNPDAPPEPATSGDGEPPVRPNRGNGRKKGARGAKAGAFDLTAEIPIGTDGEGWVEVEQPPESILNPVSDEGTVVVTPATDNPTHTCLTVTGATPDSTATVTYAVSV